MIRCKDSNDFIANSRESIDSPWHDLTTEISKISALDVANQPFIRSKDLNDYMHNTFKQF